MDKLHKILYEHIKMSNKVFYYSLSPHLSFLEPLESFDCVIATLSGQNAPLHHFPHWPSG